MQGIKGIEVEGHEADGGEGRGDLARHDAAFPNACDHKLGLAFGTALQQGQGCFHLLTAESFRCGGDRRGFLLEAAGESRQRRNP